MLNHLDPASLLAVGLLCFALVLVVMFEATNGFHDAANAVATVIYTKSLRPTTAVIWSGLMNFVGVLAGGIAVAYALVELLPAEALSPPDGGPAVAMLMALFAAALSWNVGTWWFGLPNSSSHCLIGSLVGIALGNALVHERNLGEGMHWHQLRTVLEALAVSPVLGLLLAGGLYVLIRRTCRDRRLYEPAGEHPPVWWMRAILILTCSGVSFAHGTNDGQKNIGLIMLTVIGLFPATYALNPAAGQSLLDMPGLMREAGPLIERYGDGEKGAALDAIHSITMDAHAAQGSFAGAALDGAGSGHEPRLILGPNSAAARSRTGLRDDIYRVTSQLERVQEARDANRQQRVQAANLAAKLAQSVEYAPLWVRILSALCLGIGTMFGYRRIVRTLGERLGRAHLTPAQGAAAEIVAALLIGVAGFTGLPVSTTHIVTSGIGGTMVASGAGLRLRMLSRILIAWVCTLPVTILVSGGLYFILADPRL